MLPCEQGTPAIPSLKCTCVMTADPGLVTLARFDWAKTQYSHVCSGGLKLEKMELVEETMAKRRHHSVLINSEKRG